MTQAERDRLVALKKAKKKLITQKQAAEEIGGKCGGQRLLATLSSFFGALALLLACVGLYGLMAYTVARRTAEIGIRLALGARRDHIMWLVLRETLWLTLAGIAAGFLRVRPMSCRG